MKHSFVDRYAFLDSPLHLLEARTKIIGFSALMVAVLALPQGGTGGFFLFFFLISIFAGISQIPMPYLVGRTLVLLPFVLLAGLAAPSKGAKGWIWFLILMLRSSLGLLILIILTNTTRFVELLRGLRRLGCPRILVAKLNFPYRYFFVLFDEAMRMKQARDCRRVGRTSAVAELRMLGSMSGKLLVRAFERAEHMYQAMLSRGFSGDFPVTAPRRFSWRDLAFISVVALVIAATIYL